MKTLKKNNEKTALTYSKVSYNASKVKTEFKWQIEKPISLFLLEIDQNLIKNLQNQRRQSDRKVDKREKRNTNGP